MMAPPVDVSHRLVKSDAKAYYIPKIAIEVALVTINLLGILGVFPSSHAGVIVGSINCGLILLVQANEYRFNKTHGQSFKWIDHLELATALAVSSLGICNVLTAYELGLATLGFVLTRSIRDFKFLYEHRKEWKELLYKVLDLAIPIIGFLGAVGVFSGNYALGISTFAAVGVILFLKRKEWDKVTHLSWACYGICMAMITFLGTPTTQLGVGVICGGIFIYYINGYYSSYKLYKKLPETLPKASAIPIPAPNSAASAAS